MTVIFLFLLGCVLLWKLPTVGLKRYDLIIALVIKCLFCALFFQIYADYYGTGALSADAGLFMKESKILHDVSVESWGDYFKFIFGLETQEMIMHHLGATDHWSSGNLILINDAQNVMRVNSLIYFISGGDIKVHLLLFSLFIVLGIRELYLTFHNKIFIEKRLFFLLLLVLPSLAFWSASMLKEPLMIVGLCLILRAQFGELTFKKRIVKFIVGSVLMLLFKPYVFFILIGSILVFMIANICFKRKVWLATLVVFTAGSILFMFNTKSKDELVAYLTRKQFDFINVGQGGLHAYADSCFYYFREDQYDGITFFGGHHVRLEESMLAKKVKLGSAQAAEDVYLKPTGKIWINYYSTYRCGSFIPVTQINNSSSQLIKNIPEAFVNAAFRPFFGDPGGNLKYFNIVETLILFGWLLFTLLFFRKYRSFEDNQLIWTFVVFSILLFLLIGFTTPVLGAIARYRIPAYLMLFICSVLGSKKKQLI